MNTKVKLFALALFLGIGVAHAELGDTLAQLRSRYGEVVAKVTSQDGTEFVLFKWRPFIVLVGFMGGKSCHEAFKRFGDQPMTNTDLARCLPMGKWKQRDAGVWVTSGDPKLADGASYSPYTKELRVFAREWLNQHGAYSPVTIEAWLASATEGQYVPQ